MTPLPSVGWVRISATDPPVTLDVRLADERPNLDSGYGGWEQIERPLRPPLTTFKAPPARQLTLPVLFDSFLEGEASVEKELAQLVKLARPLGSNKEPPQVSVHARGGALPGQGLSWVVSDLAWGDALMNANGDRCRQQVTLTLIEYVADLYLTEKSAAALRRSIAQGKKKQAGASKKRVAAKKGRTRSGGGRSALAGNFGEGEDLLSLAARELGDASRWVEIAQLNGLRDPRAIRPGQVLRLP